jgi:hypothetical protein
MSFLHNLRKTVVLNDNSLIYIKNYQISIKEGKKNTRGKQVTTAINKPKKCGT